MGRRVYLVYKGNTTAVTAGGILRTRYERHYTQCWGGQSTRGTRLWPEGLRQACEAKSGLTESERCVRRTVRTKTTVRRESWPARRPAGRP